MCYTVTYATLFFKCFRFNQISCERWMLFLLDALDVISHVHIGYRLLLVLN